MRVVCAALMLGALLTNVCGLHAAEIKRTLKLHQDKPVLSKIDIGAPGPTEGDMLAFTADLHGDGNLKAQLYGLLVVVDLPDGEDVQEDRAGQIYVDFGEGSSLIIEGRSVYATKQTEMSAGVPQLRAVIGGTGEYVGARGQVSTTRNKDGSYEHVIELLD